MKYLITGGCGFLGSNLAAEVIKRGEKLCVFDNLSRFGSTQNLAWLQSQGDFSFVHGDIRCVNDVESLIKEYKPDVIFHLAGQVAMTTSIANPRFDFEINALGSLNVLESVRKYTKNTIIVYSSTNKVYGDLEWVKYTEDDTRYRTPDFPHGFDENILLDFHSPYGCSKGTADQYMLDYARIYGLKTIVFRHSSMYGGRQFATYDQGWIGWFVSQAIATAQDPNRKAFTISGTGKQVRDVLYSDDLIQCYFMAVDAINNTNGKVFNIGGGFDNSISVLELLQFLENELNVKLNYKKIAWRESDQKVFIADISKAKTIFGWIPKTSQRDGLINMIKWSKANAK